MRNINCVPSLVTAPPHQGGATTHVPPMVDRPKHQEVTPMSRPFHPGNGSGIGDDCSGKQPAFSYIRHLCETDAENVEVDLSPHAFREHRQAFWPSMSDAAPPELRHIYEAVRHSGIPNAMGCRIPVPSGLNIPEWRKLLGGSQDDRTLCDYLEFGFFPGLLGPHIRHVGHK